MNNQEIDELIIGQLDILDEADENGNPNVILVLGLAFICMVLSEIVKRLPET